MHIIILRHYVHVNYAYFPSYRALAYNYTRDNDELMNTPTYVDKSIHQSFIIYIYIYLLLY